MSIPRDELDGLWARWLEANREAERLGDWGTMADFYAADATYGWMYTPDEHFMAVGREEIRRYALGTEMAGLDGWHYDYVATVVDERSAMIVGFWKQRSGIVDETTGREHEILGIGGSWFGVVREESGALVFGWQRDWFDLGSTAHTFLTLAGSRAGTAGVARPDEPRRHVTARALPARGPAVVGLAASGRGRRAHQPAAARDRADERRDGGGPMTAPPLLLVDGS